MYAVLTHLHLRTAVQPLHSLFASAVFNALNATTLWANLGGRRLWISAATFLLQ